MRTWITFILLTMAVLAMAQGLRNPAFIGNLHYVESGGTPAPWSPSDVAGLQLWFQPSTLASLGQSEGSVVSNWPSSVPGLSTRYATNATASQAPTLTNSFNGISTNALYYDGTDDWLFVSNALGVARNISNSTIIVVAQCKASTSAKGIFSICRNAANSTREYAYFDTFEKAAVGGRNADANSFVGITSGEVFDSIEVCIIGQFMHSDGNLFLYTNNVLANSTTSWQVDANTSDTDSYNIQIGGAGNTEDFYGSIAEVIYYVPAISAADQTNCWLYLSNKYALP